MTAVALLRTETKRSTVPWVLPLLAALYFFDTYRTASGYPPIWDVRASTIPNRMLFEFSVFAAGLAAWAGSREGRRKTRDLVTATARPAWARHAAALAGTMFWLVLAFLAGVAVLYVQTARQAAWGGPPLWPVAVGVVGVVTVTVIGFTAGVLFPGRFTAPLAAIVVLVLDMAGFRETLGSPGGHMLLSLSTSVPLADIGVFYPVAPDVAIAQIMFMGGITMTVLGVLALAPAFGRFGWRGTGRSLRAAGIAAVAAGVAAAGTAYGLTGTAVQGVSGWTIPALHDAASDRPLPYTPDCARNGIPVCVHPAFSSYLGDATAALDPVMAEVAGLPGAPARAVQVATDARNGLGQMTAITGTPSVYKFTGDDPDSPFWGSAAAASSADWRAGFQLQFLETYLAGPVLSRTDIPGPAQQAVITALITAVGSPGALAGPSHTQIAAAAQRFESLSPAARHAWFATHLVALRANQITLAQIP